MLKRIFTNYTNTTAKQQQTLTINVVQCLYVTQTQWGYIFVYTNCRIIVNTRNKTFFINNL